MALGALLAVAMAAAPAASTGTIFSERPLPDGAVSVFATMGYPGFDVGWRQGFSGTEFGAVAGFDYTQTRLTLDAPFRMELAEGPHHIISAGVRAGLFYDFGATWFEKTNIVSSGLRLAGELSFTARTTENFNMFFNLDTPVQIPLSERGNYLYGVRMGGGGELAVGDGYSVGAELLAGPQLLHPRGGQNTARLDLSIQVGLGRRF